MKQIFTLIAVMFSVSSFAAGYPGPKTSKIAISNNDRSMMQVNIDGKMYNLDNTFVMDNVRSGNHTITIYKTEIAGFRKRTTVIYNSSMFISPAQLISIDINRNGKVVTKTINNNRFDRDNRWDRNDRNNNYGRH
jgi:hypothetical protein